MVIGNQRNTRTSNHSLNFTQLGRKLKKHDGLLQGEPTTLSPKETALNNLATWGPDGDLAREQHLRDLVYYKSHTYFDTYKTF